MDRLTTGEQERFNTVTVESIYTSTEFPFAMSAVEVFEVVNGLVQSHTWMPTRETQEKLGIWWPSPWGLDDEIGATNYITPEKVMEAVELIQEGVIYELGRPYEAAMPLVLGRTFEFHIQDAMVQRRKDVRRPRTNASRSNVPMLQRSNAPMLGRNAASLLQWTYEFRRVCPVL